MKNQLSTWWKDSEAKKTFDSIAEWIKNKLKTATTYVTDTVFEKIPDMFDKIKNILSDKDTWTPIFTAMATAITGLFTWDNLQRIIFGTATPMADAKNTLIDKKDKAIETVSNVTAPIKNVIKNAVDFFRPEKDQATINDATGTGTGTVTGTGTATGTATGTNFKNNTAGSTVKVIVGNPNNDAIPVTPAVSTTTATAAKAETNTKPVTDERKKEIENKFQEMLKLIIDKSTATDQTMKTLTEAIAMQDTKMNSHLEKIVTNTKATSKGVNA